MSAYARLQELGIAVPKMIAPVPRSSPSCGRETWCVSRANIAKKNGQPWVGQLGSTVTSVEGHEAARGVAIDLIMALRRRAPSWAR